MTNKQQIYIVGGGFGGLYTALGLADKLNHISKTMADIHIIDPKDNFVFLPLLYELAVGSASSVEVTPKYNDLLQNKPIKFLKGAVQAVNFSSNTLELLQGNKSNIFNYDKLIIAVGIQPKLDLIPGAREFSIPFYRKEDATALRQKLFYLKNKKQGYVRVSVIGGGYSGVEVATNVAEFIGQDRVMVTIIDRNSKILSTSAPHNRDVAERALISYGIDKKCNTSVKSVTKDGLELVDEEGNNYFFNSDLVITTSGTEQSNFVKNLEISKDKFGRILTKSSLQTVDYPDVFALGDCSSVENYPVPSTAQVAMQQSNTVVDNIVKLIKPYKHSKNKTSELSSFNYIPLGEMITLGVTDGSVSTLNNLVGLSGSLASVARRLVYVVRQPTKTQAIKSLLTAGAVTTGKLLKTFFGNDK
eukprot:gene4985-6968_t